MLEELQPVGFKDAARRLAGDPFELVRLLVAAGTFPEGALLVDPEIIDKLRRVGRIEDPWWSGVSLPKDASEQRARVRAAVRLLLDKGRVGEDRTRMDNVWRGLEPADRQLLQRALKVLAEEGMVRIFPSPIGALVSIEPAAVDRAKKLVAGKLDSPGLAALFAEG